MLDGVFKQIATDGTLHVRAADGTASDGLRSLIRALGLAHVEAEGTTTVTLVAEKLWPFVQATQAHVDPAELRTLRAIFVPAGRAARVADYFEAEPLERILERIRATWLIEMLGAGNFTSAFQPLVRASSRDEIFGYEALFRGCHAAAAFAPLELFEIARKVDLALYLDLVARETAISEAARCGLRGKLFLNITPSAFIESGESLGEITTAFAHYGIDRERVVFELVETEAMRDPKHFATIAERYRAAGFAIALDDLGSGYASMQTLNDVRPEYVKLDMSLIRDVHLDEYKALIASKLIETAHVLDAHVVAEGVETRAEFEWCRHHGADFVQGYFIAQPQTPELLLSA